MVSPSERAPDLGKRLFGGHHLNGTVFNFVDATAKLFVPRGLNLDFVRVETREQFFGEARALLRRKGLCLGGQFGDEVGHAMLQEPGPQFTPATQDRWFGDG